MWNEIPSEMKPKLDSDSFVESSLCFATSDMAIINEADNKEYSQKLKKYL